jgi:hypothetical protein
MISKRGVGEVFRRGRFWSIRYYYARGQRRRETVSGAARCYQRRQASAGRRIRPGTFGSSLLITAGLVEPPHRGVLRLQR